MRYSLLPYFLLFSLQQASAQFQFVSPMPGSKNLNIEHNIILREGNVLDASSLKESLFIIRGSKSAVHGFKMILCDDGKTINLNPTTPFAYDEDVAVTITKGLVTAEGKIIDGYSFSFNTHREYTAEEQQHFHDAKNILLQEELKRYGVSNNDDASSGTRNVTGEFTIEVNTAPSPVDIFFDSWSENFQNSNYNSFQIITPDGDSVYGGKNLLYYQDFKVNLNGYLTVYDGDLGSYNIMDSNFHIIDKYYPANGYESDDHEFQMLPDGRAFMIADDPEVVDMTEYDPGYFPNATVVGNVIQEFDADHNLIFEWRTFDHIGITEALHEHLNFSYIEYTHTNSIDIDTDGNIIVSHRHLDQITKIDISTGDFIWRLGGVMNEFTFINEPEPFTYQHDVRRIANGHITVWDNGNFHFPHHSAAKEYALDEINKTATLVWCYTPLAPNGTNTFFFAMGSVQRLSNGNTFIDGGWESNNTYSNMWEIDTSNQVVWQLKLTDVKSIVSYRARKFDWSPCARPSFKEMQAKNITDHSAKLKWAPVANATQQYEVQYKKHPDLIWIDRMIDPTEHNKKVYGLAPDTKYDWRVQSWCDTVAATGSHFTAIKKFTTLVQRPVLLTETKPIEISVYPNPAHDVITIGSTGNISQVRVLNLPGQEVMNVFIGEEDSNRLVQLSLSNLPAGNYFVEVTSDGQKEMMKMVVE